MVARYPHLYRRPDLALKLVVAQLGGGESVEEPTHARRIPVTIRIGLAKPLIVAPATVSLYWGDSSLKNYDYTPRVYANDICRINLGQLIYKSIRPATVRTGYMNHHITRLTIGPSKQVRLEVTKC